MIPGLDGVSPHRRMGSWHRFASNRWRFSLPMNRKMRSLISNGLCISGSWPQLTSNFWRCPLSMNLGGGNETHNFEPTSQSLPASSPPREDVVHGPKARQNGRRGLPKSGRCAGGSAHCKSLSRLSPRPTVHDFLTGRQTSCLSQPIPEANAQRISLSLVF